MKLLTPYGSYTCAHCHKTYDRGWSDDEARDESHELFLYTADDDTEEWCDDCWRWFMENHYDDFMTWNK